MKTTTTLFAILSLALSSTGALAQKGNEQPAPGMAGSRNMKLMSHIALGGPFYANDIKVEQELSRPYAYVSGRSHFGFYIINLKDPGKASLLYSWQIENAGLHQGRALSAMHLKINGRYYLTQSF